MFQKFFFNPNNMTSASGCSSWHPPQNSDYTLLVGVDDLTGECLSSSETLRQINFLKTLECKIMHQGKKVSIKNVMIEARDAELLLFHSVEADQFQKAFVKTFALSKIKRNTSIAKLIRKFGKKASERLNRRSLFDYIIFDRQIRIDQNKMIVDRPSTAVVTVENNAIIRLEFYKGHDSLRLILDLRSDNLSEKDLPIYLPKDNLEYDPVIFLKSLWGISPPAEYFEMMHSSLLYDFNLFTLKESTSSSRQDTNDINKSDSNNQGGVV